MSLTLEQRAHDLAISQLNRVLEEKVLAERAKRNSFDPQNISITQTYQELYLGFLEKLKNLEL